MKPICVLVGNEYKGFLFGMARILNRIPYTTLILTYTDQVRRLAREKVPEMTEGVITVTPSPLRCSRVEFIAKAVEAEKKYGVTLAMLISHDRGLGQGYQLNADLHPHVAKSKWSHTRKLKEVLEQIDMWESLCKTGISLIVGCGHNRILDMVCNHYGIHYLSIASAKYADRYMFYETSAEENSRLTELLLHPVRGTEEDIQYETYAQHTVGVSGLDYSYRGAVKRAVNTILRETYIRVRGAGKEASYGFCGWVPPILRRPSAYRYVKRNGITLKHLDIMPVQRDKLRVVYFPLQMEPESSLLNVSPEFNNSTEVATWVSKSLPADILLVIKENPWSYGVRSKRYYDHLIKMPNVVLSDPTMSSLDWIDRSSLVVTITGTAGIEAVYRKRPVLSFGAHQCINYLSTVRYAHSYSSTRIGIEQLLKPFNPKEYDYSLATLHNAIMDVSFPIPGHETGAGSAEPETTTSAIAVDQLRKRYIEVTQ